MIRSKHLRHRLTWLTDRPASSRGSVTSRRIQNYLRCSHEGIGTGGILHWVLIQVFMVLVGSCRLFQAA